MVNLKTGIIGVIATGVVVIIELVLFPIALTFQSNLNGSGITRNATGSITNEGWLSATDRTILGNASTLMIVTILFTLLGGVIGSVYYAVKG